MGGKKKKNNSHNDFFFFLQEQKKVLRNEGRVWNTPEELNQFVNPRWKLLTEKDRERYKEMARQAKEMAKKDLSSKFDAQGRSLLDIESEKQELQAARREMEARIAEIVQSSNQMGILAKQKFFFIHFNTLCVTQKNDYVPCEMTVLEMSLAKGVTRVLHSFIRPQVIEPGYGFLIEKNAASSHQLSLDSDPMESRDAKAYSWIWKNLMKMIRPKGHDQAMPPLYTTEEDEEKVKSILFTLNDWASEPRTASEIKIFHVEELYHSITQELATTKLSRTMAKDKLVQDPYIYSIGNACEFHEQIDRAVHCSTYLAKKWAYIICDHCCSFFDIDLVPGRHVPEDADVHLPVQKPELIQMSLADYSEAEATTSDFVDDDGVRRTRAYASGIMVTGAASENFEIKFEKVQRSLFEEDPKLGTFEVAPARGDSFDMNTIDWSAISKGEAANASSNSPSFGAAWLKPKVRDNTPKVEDPEAFPSLGGRGRGRGSGSTGGRGNSLKRGTGAPGRGRGVDTTLSWGMSNVNLR